MSASQLGERVADGRTGLPRDARECVDVARRLRAELTRLAPEIDRSGRYPAECMDLIDSSGVGLLALPRSAGGIASEEPLDDFADLIEVLTHIAAGESSTAQMWAFHRLTSYALLGRESPLSADRRQAILDLMKRQTVRFCAPNNEHSSTFGSYSSVARRVDGGVRVSGTKYFATGSEGARYAESIVVTQGFAGIQDGTLHKVLVDLTDPGARLGHDWDNMGQRATGSGSLEYHDVFVPDGMHWSVAGFTWGARPTFSYAITAIVLGIGLGALDALVDFLKHQAAYKAAPEDKVIRHYVGRFSAKLTCAQEALRAGVQRAVAAERSGHKEECEAAAILSEQVKVEVVDAALYVCGEMHRLCGGQSTSGTYDLDRFWRNARTLSVQNVLDVGIDRIAGWMLR